MQRASRAGRKKGGNVKLTVKGEILAALLAAREQLFRTDEVDDRALAWARFRAALDDAHRASLRAEAEEVKR